MGVQMELETVKEENTKLVEELSVFDMEFFDELEDLKFRCQELEQQQNGSMRFFGKEEREKVRTRGLGVDS